MILKNKGFVGAFVFVALQSCAGLQEMQNHWIAENCSIEPAKNDGLADALNGMQLNDQQYRQCPIQNQDSILKAYRDGYLEGQNQLNARASGNVIPASGGVVIQIGSGGSNPQNQRAWFCKSKAFMDYYEAFGPTQLEAKRQSLADCAKAHHEMHCRIEKCEPNR